MESTISFLERASCIIIFCMATWGLIFANRTMESTISSLKDTAFSEQTLYEQSLETIYMQEITYEELLGILMGELVVDIRINQMELRKEEYNPNIFDFSVIVESSYNKTYELHENGSIKKIIYTSINR